MEADLVGSIALLMGLLVLAFFIRGELSKVALGVRGIETTLGEMQKRLAEVQKATNASHRRLDEMEKELIRVKVLQERIH